MQQKAATLALDQHARFDSFASSLEQIKTIVTTRFQQHTMGGPKMPRVADIEDVRDLMAKVTLAERDMVGEQEVLRSLSDEHYLDRYQSIAPAHKKTFSWVFHPSNTSSEGKRLGQWLRQGQGVFWITGKPGSGKSTMMKFLCDDAQTIMALKEWACGGKLAIVSHYFWLSGTMIQKSQEGLFRSLLYGIFQQCPELIRRLCPARWAAAGQDADNGSRQPHWTLNDLLTAISSFQEIPQLGSKFCIFVDGLDEYHGDHIEMCNTIQKLGTASHDIKLCVSSRPWNDFEDAFGGGQNFLEMHQLTTGDICGYAHARLSEHWAWAIVSANTDLAVSLIDLILRHAEGVFLWVVLVTKELREGLSNYDSLEDLYRRVEGFPSDLGEFFKHILESVDPFYHAKMSTALQLCLAAPEPLQLPIYYFHEREHADSDYALKLPILQPTEEADEERDKIIEKRLKGWCKGFLEVKKQNGLVVQFLHRTVRDFLETPEMIAFLETKTPVHFSACLSIVKAYTAWMKSRTFYDRPENIDTHGDPRDIRNRQYQTPFYWMTLGLLSAAHEVEDEQDQIEVWRHIGEFERSAVELENQGHMTFESYKDEYAKDVKHAAGLFREYVFRHDMVLYLSYKITNEQGYFNLHDMNRLVETLPKFRRSESFCAALRLVVERVLEGGEDPNKKVDPGDRSSSLFAMIMLGCKDPGYHWGKQLIDMRLVSLFMDYGAEPNASLNALGWNPCRVMLAIPLEEEPHSFDGDAYLQQLDSLLHHGADSEAKMEEQDQGLSDTPTSAREWFFKEVQRRLASGWHLDNEIIGHVVLGLLPRIEDKEEVDAAWRILETTLPREVYWYIKGSVAGRKRKRDGDQQQFERESEDAPGAIWVQRGNSGAWSSHWRSMTWP